MNVYLMGPEAAKKRVKRDANPLGLLFASSAREAVLRMVLTDPLRSYYQRQIEAVTGLAIRAVQREVERLSKAGLLYRREEGNRIYYHVDLQFPLFQELRSMVLKTAAPVDRFRGWAAMDDRIRLAFLDRNEGEALIVTTGAARPAPEGGPYPFAIRYMTSDVFTAALAGDRGALQPFLSEGSDLLGRRDDVIWRRIELAGYTVPKAKGVA